MSKHDRINGFFEGSGASPFSARADHTHGGEDGYLPADTPVVKAVKKTISVADWDGGAAEVSFTDGEYIGYHVAAASQSAATDAALVFTSAGTGKLQFGCTGTPEEAIDLYILYL